MIRLSNGEGNGFLGIEKGERGDNRSNYVCVCFERNHLAQDFAAGRDSLSFLHIVLSQDFNTKLPLLRTLTATQGKCSLEDFGSTAPLKCVNGIQGQCFVLFGERSIYQLVDGARVLLGTGLVGHRYVPSVNLRSQSHALQQGERTRTLSLVLMLVDQFRCFGGEVTVRILTQLAVDSRCGARIAPAG